MVAELRPYFNNPGNESAKRRVRELPQFKENWQVNFGVLTISGESGTGKTTLAEILSLIYGISGDRNIKIGQIIRNITDNKSEGFMERSIETDIMVDDAQRKIMREADSKSPLILEARLAAIIGKEEKEKSPQLPIVSVLLTASPIIAAERIKSRKSDLPERNETTITQTLEERAKKDLEHWKLLHPNLNNPYDPEYFNLIIDTDFMSPEEVFIFLHDWLLKNRLISEAEKTNESPAEHQIFPTPNL